MASSVWLSSSACSWLLVGLAGLSPAGLELVAALSRCLDPAGGLGVMAFAGYWSSSLAVRGVGKWSRLGRGPVVDIGVASSVGFFSPLSPPEGVGGVVLKKVWMGGEPLMPAPLHSLRKLAVVMILLLLSRCSCMPQCVQRRQVPFCQSLCVGCPARCPSKGQSKQQLLM